MTDHSGADLILATASPRRRRLFAMLGLDYTCVPTDTPEELDTPLARDPEALVATLAAEKAVAARSEGAQGLVLAFDTVVLHGGRILGKPADLDDARRMLADLSGCTHQVATGVALLTPGAEEPETFSVLTPVRMRDLDDSTVDAWVARGELLGCAGAYNIESHLAEVNLDECFQNVAGIPLCHLYVELRRMAEEDGTPDPVAPVAPCDAARGVRCLLGPRLVSGTGRPR